MSNFRAPSSVPALLALLAAFAAAPGSAAASDRPPHALEQLVARAAAALEILHTKAKRTLVTAAQDRTFSDFVASSAHHRDDRGRDDRGRDGQGHDDPRHQHLRQRVDAISLAVQSRFEVEEMCLIAPDGAELSRVVGGRVAYDLSPDERGASFFAPGFASPARHVYVSRVYLSPDAHKWVVAYVTPVREAGRNSAILHYEHSLNSYQQALRRGLAADAPPLVLLLSEDGYIIGHSRERVAIDRVGDSEEPADYFARFAFGGMDLASVLRRLDAGEELVDADGRRWRGAYRTVERWTLLAIEPV